ncbi:MAG: MATE family efflux transporter [Oscillospiraceae bacterium]
MRIENDLGRDEIKRLVLRIALPSMLAQFVSVLYSIVDRIYIGNIPGIGTLALAGVGICGPVVTMVGSFAFLVGVGGAPLMSIAMGEKNLEQAKKILANCFLLLCVCSVLVMGLLYPLREPMLRLFGASDTLLPYADIYFSIYLTGTVFALLSLGLNQFIICQGFAKVGMQSVVLGAILNIVLDPIFIFALHLDVAGAAIATVLSQLASCIYVLCFLFRRDIPVRITFRGYSARIMGKVLGLGLTPFVIIAMDNLMIIVMNAVLQQYGGPARGDFLITCATIAQSFMLLVTMPLGGITGGTGTILSYNYGARQASRVRAAQRSIFLLCIAYTALLFVLARTAGPLFIRLFTTDGAVAKQTLWAIGVCTLAIVPMGIQYGIVDGFTALGKMSLSLPLSFFRKTVYFVALFLLPYFFGADMTFYAQPISDVIAPVVTVTVYSIAMGRILRRREDAPETPVLSPEIQTTPEGTPAF